MLFGSQFRKESFILISIFFVFDGTFGLVLKPILWIFKSSNFKNPFHKECNNLRPRPVASPIHTTNQKFDMKIVCSSSAHNSKKTKIIYNQSNATTCLQCKAYFKNQNPFNTRQQEPWFRF
jgi:hypothetical protein